MKYRTVQLELTNPRENIADLMNLLAIVSFKAGMPRKWVKLNVERIVDEQYVQSILNTPQQTDVIRNKPTELS